MAHSKSGLALLIGVSPKRGAPPRMHEDEMSESEETPPVSRSEKPEKVGGYEISPEMVAFRTAEQVCGNCRHMQGDNCDLLGISVAQGDSCHAYSEKEGGGEPPMRDAYKEEEAEMGVPA